MGHKMIHEKRKQRKYNTPYNQLYQDTKLHQIKPGTYTVEPLYNTVHYRRY